MKRHRIGEWTFDAASGELSRGGERRRLEPRAARTLELLCEGDGQIVSHDRLIADVWGGRNLSENSVSVVISQLRRTLGDNARKPAMIETVPKRGYRLVKNDNAESTFAAAGAYRRGVSILALILALLMAGIAVGVLTSNSADEPPTIAVGEVTNETGSANFDPLARAIGELIVTQLTRRGLEVRRGAGEADLRMSSRLVLWNGRPSLSIAATDDHGVVRWSGMTNGTADQLPAGVAAELDGFQASLAKN